MQAHFRSVGITSPPLLSTDDQKGRPFWCALSRVRRFHWHSHALRFRIEKISLRMRILWRDVLSTINPATRNLTSQLDPKIYFGGIWSSVDLEEYGAYREDYPIDYTLNDVADYHHDLSLLDDFPLPSVEGEPGKHLKYIPGKNTSNPWTKVMFPWLFRMNGTPPSLSKVQAHIGRIGLRSRLLSESSSFPPLFYFTSRVGFFLEIRI